MKMEKQMHLICLRFSENPISRYCHFCPKRGACINIADFAVESELCRDDLAWKLNAHCGCSLVLAGRIRTTSKALDINKVRDIKL